MAEGAVVSAAVCTRKQNADPVAALKEFNEELQAFGIHLILVPVPPKLAIHPVSGLQPGEAMVYLKPFYQELRDAGIDVLDMSDCFLAEGPENAFCRTDAHWSPVGIEMTAREIMKKIDFRGNEKFTQQRRSADITGDLASSLAPDSPESEQVSLPVVSGQTLDENSSILLIGDSHTLVFSTGGDMLAERSGLAEQLALQAGMGIDRIAVKGSAATSVRVNLYRRASRNPEWLKNKKVIIYCFSCREFTESTSGWVKVPVLKK